MGRRLPNRISLSVRAGGHPFPGGWVAITLDTLRKNSFHAFFGPADDAGRLEVTRDDLLHEATETVNLFPMDYGHPEADWSGRLAIKPLGRGDVAHALEAYDGWSQAGVEYATGYHQALQDLDERLRARPGLVLTADVELNPPRSADVITQEQLV